MIASMMVTSMFFDENMSSRLLGKSCLSTSAALSFPAIVPSYTGWFSKTMPCPGRMLIATTDDTAKDARNITKNSTTVLTATLLRDFILAELMMPVITAHTSTGSTMNLISLR